MGVDVNSSAVWLSLPKLTNATDDLFGRQAAAILKALWAESYCSSFSVSHAAQGRRPSGLAEKGARSVTTRGFLSQWPAAGAPLRRLKATVQGCVAY